MRDFDSENAKHNLSKGNYQVVIDLLLEFTKETIFHREAINVSIDYETYKQNLRSNLYFDNEEEVRRNRLVNRIYGLISKIERYKPLFVRFSITKKRSNFISVILFVGLVFWINAAPLNNGDFVFDRRDWNLYRTVKRNGYEFMIDNLNYHTKDTTSWCYANNSTNCMKYGRLYNWESAKTSCLGLGHGWRLPTRLEIKNVMDTLPQKMDVKMMLGGQRTQDGEYFMINEAGHIWTNDKSYENYVWIIYAYGIQGEISWHGAGEQKSGFSCRCIREIE